MATSSLLRAALALILLGPALGWPDRVARAQDAGANLVDDPAGDLRLCGDLRLRAQVDASRDLASAADPAAVFPVLARSGVDASLSGDYTAHLLLGAAGALGSGAREPSLFLDEAWIDARLDLLGGLARLRLGRQALELHDGRLLSDEGFLDRPRRVDGVRATAAIADLEVETFVSFVSTLLADPLPARDVAPEDLLGGALASYQPGRILRVRGHALGHLGNPASAIDVPAVAGDEREPLRIVTLGLEARLQPRPWLASSAALSVQLGEARALEQQAYDLQLNLELTGPWPGRPGLRLGYDQASGDRQPFDLRSNAFRNPLGERHGRFGAADLLAPRNAQDLHAALRVDDDGSWAELSLHRLALDSTRDDWFDAAGQQRLAAPAGDERLLGHELDLQGYLAAHEQIGLELLYAVFLPGGVARSALGPQAAHRLLLGVRATF